MLILNLGSNYILILSFNKFQAYPADNLLKPDIGKSWKCAKNNSEKQASVIIKFDKLSTIRSIDIGNEGSAFVEVLVSRGDADFKVS